MTDPGNNSRQYQHSIDWEGRLRNCEAILARAKAHESEDDPTHQITDEEYGELLQFVSEAEEMVRTLELDVAARSEAQMDGRGLQASYDGSAGPWCKQSADSYGSTMDTR